METDTIKKFFIAIAALLASIAVSYLIGHRNGRIEAIRGDSESVDTLVVHDTITQYEPILEERVVLQKVLVPVTDTLWAHDTMFVYLEREQVVWQDSLSCVYASGIQPQVDSVHHYVTERVVTRDLTHVVKKPCKWGIGVHVGYGVQLGEQMKSSPYVGVGISYNLLSW